MPPRDPMFNRPSSRKAAAAAGSILAALSPSKKTDDKRDEIDMLDNMLEKLSELDIELSNLATASSRPPSRTNSVDGATFSRRSQLPRRSSAHSRPNSPPKSILESRTLSTVRRSTSHIPKPPSSRSGSPSHGRSNSPRERMSTVQYNNEHAFHNEHAFNKEMTRQLQSLREEAMSLRLAIDKQQQLTRGGGKK